jgi:hypothetical protein
MRVAASNSQVLLRLQSTLGLTQKGLGDLMGVSSRTIIRHTKGGGMVPPAKWEKLARAVHPRDPAFAAELAANAGKTLVEMGLERPPPPPPPPAPPLPPPKPAPSLEHLVDSVLCAAADAMQMAPRAMRPALTAAVERMAALGLTPKEVLGSLAPPVTTKGKKAATE